VDLDARPTAVDQLGRPEEVENVVPEDVEAPQYGRRRVTGDHVAADRERRGPDQQAGRLRELAVEQHSPVPAPAPPAAAHERTDLRVTAVVEACEAENTPPWAAMRR
jgi:hypothetical protein